MIFLISISKWKTLQIVDLLEVGTYAIILSISNVYCTKSRATQRVIYKASNFKIKRAVHIQAVLGLGALPELC